MTMKLGIDFGTSYSCAAVAFGGDVKLITFNTGDQFRMAAYFPEKVPTLSEFEPTPHLQKMAENHVRQARAEHARNVKDAQVRRRKAMEEKDLKRRAKLLELIAMPRERTEDEFRHEGQRVMRQHWLDEQMRKAKNQVGKSMDAVFGEEAIDAFLSEGTGRLFQSPKSLLGYSMNERVRTTITDIVGNVFDHIRWHATAQLKVSVNRAIIGRPVVFRSSMAERGTRQALDILRAAATNAGFDEIEFMEEPVAAAMAFHRECRDRANALIFDIGGGTTDFAFVELGGSKRPQVLGSWGLPMGGSDVDREFSLAAFMPLFGKSETEIPNKDYFDAAAVTDTVRQAAFLKHDYKKLDPPFGPRLRALQVHGRTSQLGRTVERSKIHLSEHDTCNVRIGYIEKGLIARSDRALLLESSTRIRLNIERKLEEIKRDLGKVPDVVFLTGGMSRSPFVVDMVSRYFPASKAVKGNASFGVVHGLACSGDG